MTPVRVVLACSECQVHWQLDAEPPRCTDPGHSHQRFELHVHRSVVTLPDGTPLTAVSFDPSDPYSRVAVPHYGLYLDRRWRPPWPHDCIDWPDFGVPEDKHELLTSLASLLARARGGRSVELGCFGGHGRTGTALACLAMLSGQPPTDAVEWVRANYCQLAVETEAQEAFVHDMDS